MKERPILFNGPMVRAIIDGTKTQTRQIVKPQPYGDAVTHDNARVTWFGYHLGLTDDGFVCPYGVPGDRLWVRETWRPVMEAWRTFVEYRADEGRLGRDVIASVGPWTKNVDRCAVETVGKVALRFSGHLKSRHSEQWHPSGHMPRWASRLTLEVTEVRVERLQAISEADARAEGVSPQTWDAYAGLGGAAVYAALWDEINGAGAWAQNPWVWVVGFKRVTAP